MGGCLWQGHGGRRTNWFLITFLFLLFLLFFIFFFSFLFSLDRFGLIDCIGSLENFLFIFFYFLLFFHFFIFYFFIFFFLVLPSREKREKKKKKELYIYIYIYKWHQPQELFRHVKGFYVGWVGEQVPETVRGRGAGVTCVGVDRGRRFRDREVCEVVCMEIERWMVSTCWGQGQGGRG